MRWEHIFFDLDGTLTDPAPGITNAIIYGRKKWGLPCGPNEEYLKFIGPPMPQSYVDFWGMSPEEAVEFLKAYREYFSTVGLFENKVFPGIPELLKKLKNAGCRLYIATTKPTVYSVQIAEKFGFAEYFEIISGCGLDGTRGEKWEVIDYARQVCGADMSKAVMIGDRLHDVEGARICGIDCIGVSYGYGGRAELEQAGALHVVDTVEELGEYLFAG